MKNLTPVHHGLRRLRQFRAMVRLGSAWSVVLCVLLWALTAAFLLDFWLRMGRLERGIMLAAVAATALWAFVRYLVPAYRLHEDDVSLALLVERRQGLNSDLVAALQFADGGREQYGSGSLREAVVDCTAEASSSLNFLEGFSRERLLRRAVILLATAAMVVLPAASYPAHTRAFLDRLFLLGGAHYPTRTSIERIVSPADRYAAYGRAVVFKIQAGGEMPKAGHVQLRTLASDVTTTVDLSPDPNEPRMFVGTLHRVLDDLTYVVYLGDAYTESMELKLIPLPLVQVALNITPPDYAAARFRAESEAGRQAIAPEGSSVGLTVTADKKLSAGTVTVDKDVYAMKAADASAQGAPAGGLVLAPAGTVFEKVAEPLRFKVQVTDEHGLNLERPISGAVQVAPDRPPRVAAAAVSRYVLPTASPMVLIKALDDYGVRELILHQTIAKGDDPNQTPVHTATTIAKPGEHPATLPMWQQLKFTPLGLNKGDRVTIVLEAIDWRGSLEGKSGKSDPIVFLVTDRAGLLEAMDKLDERMIEKLDEIIRAQLGIGD